MVDVDVHVSSHLKEELTWVISTIMLLKNSKSIKDLKGTNE